MKKKQYDDDDGRVIAPMNVDGMPWYNRQKSLPGSDSKQEKIPLSKAETAAFAWGALKAALLVAFVFIIVIGGFILLLDILMNA